LKNVAERMEKLSERYKFDRLVLSGTQEVVSELKSLLADRLQKSVVGTIPLPADAGIAEIMAETIKLQENHERSGEMKLVQGLLTAAAKNQLAVTGLNGILEAVVGGRIRHFVYSDRYSSQGSECQDCRSLFASKLEKCPRCEGVMVEVEDLVESLVVRVVSDGGILEQVKGEAAEELTKHAGGLGAFLRF
jgi:peptide subunit release factor 1 (eRF1)